MHWTVHLGATSGLSVNLVLRLRNPDVVPYSHLIPCLRTLFQVPCSVHLLAWLSASVCMRNTFILPSALIPSPDTEFLLEIFLSIKFFFFPPLFPCSHSFQQEMCNHPFLCSFIHYVSLFLDCFYYICCGTDFKQCRMWFDVVFLMFLCFEVVDLVSVGLARLSIWKSFSN